MTLFSDCSNSPSGSAILLSVKPRFADLIVDGSKRVELRRAIPALPVGTLAIYSSSPIQLIVALVDVAETVEASPSRLWALAKENGGGLTRAELLEYFDAKTTGFAFMLANVRVFESPVSPRKIFKSFAPPQSFKYLSAREMQKLDSLAKPRSTR